VASHIHLPRIFSSTPPLLILLAFLFTKKKRIFSQSEKSDVERDAAQQLLNASCVQHNVFPLENMCFFRYTKKYIAPFSLHEKVGGSKLSFNHITRFTLRP